MEASGPALAAGGHSMAAVAWWAGAYCFPGAGFALGGHGGGATPCSPYGTDSQAGAPGRGQSAATRARGGTASKQI